MDRVHVSGAPLSETLRHRKFGAAPIDPRNGHRYFYGERISNLWTSRDRMSILTCKCGGGGILELSIRLVHK